MKLSSNWLKQFVKFTKKPQDIARDLTLKTAEVEGIIDFKEQYKNIVTGKILEFKKLEGSDKLHISKVDVGTHVAQILFGAVHGVQPGWIVPVALPGAKLPNGMEIQKRKMMGIESEGMLCADEELELPLSEGGFKVFPEGTKVGQPLVSALGLDDIVLEIDNKSLSHRADLWSHMGFAREVAAITGVKFLEPRGKTWKQLRVAKKKSKLAARIIAKQGAKRYMAVRIDGVVVGESSADLKARLIAVGLRPISNIVDITNFVMYEMGQPLHAFDATKISGAIQVRFANAREKLQTLDGQMRELKETDLVIADAVKPIALAGVMGGANSEISGATTSIILEAATFDAATVRKTSRRFGLLSDASLRFEKTLSPELAEAALLRACELVLEACPHAVIASNVSDVKNFAKKAVVLNVSHEYIEASLGIKIPKAKVIAILKGLGFGVSGSAIQYKIMVPSSRATKDVTLAQDIVEEIARIYGFEHIPSVLPKIQALRRDQDPQLVFNKKLRAAATALGKNELYTYSFVDEKKIRAAGFNVEDHLKLQSTAYLGQSFLQISLIPNVLSAVAKNIPNFDSVNVFELDRVFRKQPGGYDIEPGSKKMLPHQPYRFVSVTSAKQNISFAYVRGEVSVLLESLGYAKDGVVFSQGPAPKYFDNTQTARIFVQGKSVGFVGVFGKNILNAFKIRQGACGFVLDADVLAALDPKKRTYQVVTKFPSVIRDIAVVVSMQHSAQSVLDAIQKSSSLVKSVEVFDVYRGKGIPDNARSLAFRITYQVSSRTLTDKEVDEEKARLENQLVTKFQAQVRK